MEGDYYLSFVEFDDQGWFHDRKQMEGLMRLLEKEEQEGKEFQIIVYAHGWRHNASSCDGNVICFQRQLARLSIWEKEKARLRNNLEGEEGKYKPRTVVGVYVGWRGLSANVPPLEVLSF